jgi:serine protease
MPHRNRLAERNARGPSPFVALVVIAAWLLAAAPASAAEFVPGEVIVRHTGEPGTEVVSVGPGETVRGAVAELEADPDVKYAVPNYKAHASAIWNDPGRSGEPTGWTDLQWNFVGDASINAPDAWDLAAALGAPGGRGAVVAVIDTGAAYRTHGRFKRAPDLRRSTFVRGYDFVDNDRRPFDRFGHGTHVAGTIAQHVNNGIGVTGLAYNAKIMPVRVLDENGEGGAHQIARGIRYAARHDADVVNLSLEFDPSITARQVPGIISAIRFAHRKGAVVVAAAGNESDANVAYPARAKYAISVGATTEHLCQADYSNSGFGLDVVAPGGGNDADNDDNPHDAQYCHPELTGRDIYQQTFTRSPRRFGLPGGYQGTSMAAPHVSAIAALVIATGRLGANPRPGRVAAHLRSTARDLGEFGYDSRYGHGLVDAAAALAEPPAD